MNLGWGQLAGLIGKLGDKWTDPRRKKELLMERKRKILSAAMSDKEAGELQKIDQEILKLDREIERRAG